MSRLPWTCHAFRWGGGGLCLAMLVGFTCTWRARPGRSVRLIENVYFSVGHGAVTAERRDPRVPWSMVIDLHERSAAEMQAFLDELFRPERLQPLWPQLEHQGRNFRVTIPLWMLFVIVALPTAMSWSRRVRIPPGHCQKCGYNLTGNVTGRCPECGLPAHGRAAPP
jgi:hypothetical protein